MTAVDRHHEPRLISRNGQVHSAEPAEESRVLALDHDRATDPAVAGAKAAALARARRAGLPVLAGFVITAGPATEFPGALPASLEGELRQVWCELTEGGSRACVVRSSSEIEDGATSSMAGMFTSELDVRGWDGFLDAVASVRSSATSVPDVETGRMAVLVQPMLSPVLGGVLFGTDPISGREDRRMLAAVEGGPDRLVSGEVDGARYVLSRRGRVVSVERRLSRLRRAHRVALVRLADRAAEVFGGPQDIEWAIDGDGRVHLLQSRPVTATGSGTEGEGPVLGPGPVAETLPDTLSTLEEDLWLPPLRDAAMAALRLTAAASRRSIARSPVVASVSGRVAADLELFGALPRRRFFLRRLDPRPGLRRFGAAWRVGRIRAALPALAGDVVAGADEQLLEVPDLTEFGERQLLSLLHGTQPVLRALHGHEMLAGLLIGDGAPPTTAASVALWAVAEGRAAGWSDDQIAARSPVVLALTPPRIGAEPVLPAQAPARVRAADATDVGDAVDPSTLREALRLRARWVQELAARAAWELGARLAKRGALAEQADVRHLTLAELEAVVGGAEVPMAAMRVRRDRPEPAPLPAAFRLAPSGEPVAVRSASNPQRGGAGAGGGRAIGPVHQGDGAPPSGAVLVTRTLDPRLAPLLPRLGGLVAETGSVLSHLAILAREFGVPTVVGVEDATAWLQPGSSVVVDGTTGEIALVPQLDGSEPAIGGAA